MIRRYALLIGFVVIMVVWLITDKPEVQKSTRLFPDVLSAAQVTGINILDATTGIGLLLTRDNQEQWYVPEIKDIQDEIPADAINQGVIEQAALVVSRLYTDQQYEASTDNKERFGVEPNPSYLLQFQVRDSAGQQHTTVRLAVGDANPDNMAYYVWPEGDPYVYLISRLIMEPLLNLISAPTEPSSDSTTSVP
jgi:hypothetical protein